MFKYLDMPINKDEIFEVIKKCMDWFEEFFGVAYPFRKFDCVFVSNYKAEGMENCGAIVLTDEFLFKE